MDLRCSGSDAPIVTRYRHSPRRKRSHRDVSSLPRERVRSTAQLRRCTRRRRRTAVHALQTSIIRPHLTALAIVLIGLSFILVTGLLHGDGDLSQHHRYGAFTPLPAASTPEATGYRVGADTPPFAA